MYHNPNINYGGLLPLHLNRLGAALGVLNSRTRDAIGQSVADAAANLVTDVVRNALAIPGARHYGHRPDHTQPYRDPLDDEMDNRRGLFRDEAEEPWNDDQDLDETLDDESQQPVGWSVGLALALRVASLSMGRQPSRNLIVRALAVGTVCTVVVGVGGPLAVATLRLVECLLFLADLDIASSSADVLS